MHGEVVEVIHEIVAQNDFSLISTNHQASLVPGSSESAFRLGPGSRQGVKVCLGSVRTSGPSPAWTNDDDNAINDSTTMRRSAF